MTQTFIDEVRIPVTEIRLGPCVVTQIKTENKDGYNAIQIGFGWRKTKNITKPLLGHLKGAIKDKKAPSFLREVEVDDPSSFKLGDVIKVSDVFNVGDTVTVIGTTKGKGFSGAVKRWGFGGAPASHGHGGELKRVGSIGPGTSPGRVFKGKKMAGRMGNDRRSLAGMKVVSIDPDNNTLLVNGPIPGSSKSFLMVAKTKEGKVQNKESKENDEN